MTALDIANRFREKRYTSTDVKAVKDALERRDATFLGDVIAAYIKYADSVDERALIRYLKLADELSPADEIISGLSILRCKNREFAEQVLRYAKGVTWDRESYARIAAIAAIPRILKGDTRVQEVLRDAARSSNVVVRDTVLEATQELLGVPLAKIKRGLNNDDLARDVPLVVREWLDLKLPRLN